jgi:hypothetical protein
MKNVVCTLTDDGLFVYRGKHLFATVQELNGEPTIQFIFSSRPLQLTFDDIAIIQDNWNMMKELNQLPPS